MKIDNPICNEELDSIKKLSLEQITSAKDRPFENCIQLMLRVQLLIRHDLGKTYYQASRSAGKEVLIEAKKVEKSYKRWTITGIKIIAAGLQMTGGSAAAAIQFPSYANNLYAKSLAQGGDVIGKAFGLTSSVFESNEEGSRAIYNMNLDEAKRMRDMLKETSGQEEQSRREMFSLLQKVEDTRHQAFRNVSAA